MQVEADEGFKHLAGIIFQIIVSRGQKTILKIRET